MHGYKLLMVMAHIERRHLLPGFDAALQELQTNILLMGTLTRRNLSNAKRGFLTRDDDHCAAVIADDEEVDILEKPLAEQARNLDDEFTELVEVQPIRARGYVNLIAISQSFERIAYAIENVAEEAIYLSEARDVRHPGNTLEID
jgi:phosphate transport system protein